MGRSVILRREFAHHVQLFEAPAELRARADRILDQQHQLAELQARAPPAATPSRNCMIPCSTVWPL